MSAAEQLDAIEARANAATEGPWTVEAKCFCERHDNAIEMGGCRHEPWEWAVRVPSVGRGTLTYEAAIVHGNPGGPTAGFIAAARQDVPALVAALRAVLDLHIIAPADHYNICRACVLEAPCPTVLAIESALGGTP